MPTLTQAYPPELEPVQPSGLRLRKKRKTHLAIKNAALELFAEQGFKSTTVDQVAERAEVSKATFFRYFATKGEVIVSDEGDRRLLGQAILDRPADEDDLTAIRHAIQDEWVPQLDPHRVVLHDRAAATSPLLRGLSFDLGVAWMTVISESLAQRHGLDTADQRCWLVAGVAFSVFANGMNFWVREGCQGDLATAIDRAFELLPEV